MNLNLRQLIGDNFLFLLGLKILKFRARLFVVWVNEMRGMARRALRSESGDVLAKIRGPKSHEIHLQLRFSLLWICDDLILCEILAGFVRLMLEGLRNDRLPSVALDRFKTYCSDPSGDWLIISLLIFFWFLLINPSSLICV